MKGARERAAVVLRRGVCLLGACSSFMMGIAVHVAVVLVAAAAASLSLRWGLDFF